MLTDGTLPSDDRVLWISVVPYCKDTLRCEQRAGENREHNKRYKFNYVLYHSLLLDQFCRRMKV